MDHCDIYIKKYRTIEIVSFFPVKQRMLQEDNPNASKISLIIVIEFAVIIRNPTIVTSEQASGRD